MKILLVGQAIVNTVLIIFIIFEVDTGKNGPKFGLYRMLFLAPTLGAKLVLILQAYEFLSMIIIIKAQKNKNLALIMYEIHNDHNYKSFIKKEKVLKVVYIIISLIFYVDELGM